MPLLTRPCRYDRGIERQKIGLTGHASGASSNEPTSSSDASDDVRQSTSDARRLTRENMRFLLRTSAVAGPDLMITQE